MARYARTIASEARASESERERERPGVALRKGVNHWGCCAGPTDLFLKSTNAPRTSSMFEMPILEPIWLWQGGGGLGGGDGIPLTFPPPPPMHKNCKIS